MAAAATQNPAVKPESKSAKKKKTKAASSELEAPAVAEPAASATESNNGDGPWESPYLKELHKNIRNINKKITNASKVDGIVAENAGKSLDELVAARKINADQKAQILKKPALEAAKAQYEEQAVQFKKFDQEYKERAQAEKAELEKSLTERASKELEDAVAAVKAEAKSTAESALSANLLLLSQFLKLAAIRRSEDEAAELEESKALEGLLAQVYSGDLSAVAAMINLIQGAPENITSVSGETLSVTYADLKAASAAQIPAPTALDDEADETEETSTIAAPEYAVGTDPTVAHAGLTEIDDPVTVSSTNGHDEVAETTGVPANASTDEGAANAAAEASWDKNNDMSASGEWVEIPRDTAETDTGLTATPAAPSNTQSWADDQPDGPAETAAVPANPNDGFQEIQRNRGGRGNFRGGERGGRGRGDGHHRGGRGGGQYRGGGGEYRGRGGPRGGGPRGGRRPEESS